VDEKGKEGKEGKEGKGKECGGIWCKEKQHNHRTINFIYAPYLLPITAMVTYANMAAGES
jgi:hypothetical protein